MIHQLDQRVAQQPGGAIDDHQPDRAAEQCVQNRRVDELVDDEGGQNSGIDDEIAAEMQLVGADRSDWVRATT